MTELHTIPLKDCLLFKKVFNNQQHLLKHLSNFLKDAESSIIVLQFPGHSPSIEEVSETLRLLSWILTFEKGEQFSADNPIRILAMQEQDWFAELVATVASVIAIYEFIIKRLEGKFPTREEIVKDKIRKTRTKYHTVMQQVTRTVGSQQLVQQVPQNVPYQEEYFEEIESVKTTQVKTVGQMHITEIDIVVHRVHRIEIYDKNGQVRVAEFHKEESTTP